jgi:hypothetical protein
MREEGHSAARLQGHVARILHYGAKLEVGSALWRMQSHNRRMGLDSVIHVRDGEVPRHGQPLQYMIRHCPRHCN